MRTIQAREASNRISFSLRRMAVLMSLVSSQYGSGISSSICLADDSFQQGIQISIGFSSPMPESGNVTFSFVSCVSDPIGPCGVPIGGGCGVVSCSATVSCNQANFDAMATSIAAAINAADCDGYSAVVAGSGLVNVFYPFDVCLCVFDSTSGNSFPFSTNCGTIPVCDSHWGFGFGFECPTPPQASCIELADFSVMAEVIDFDSFPNGLDLSNEIPGLLFVNTQVDTNQFAVSAPNRIITDTALPQPRPPIRVEFQVPVIRAGANIDSDGFSGERQPQLRVCGQSGRVEVCDFGQGADFQGIELPDCERIVAMELGGVGLGFCRYGSTDGYDNLTYDLELCGDIDGDEVADTADITPFVGVLLGTNSDACHRNRADVNLDGMTDGLDVQPFVNCLVP
ncbi:MAG: hypothetical protein HS101_15035 [Planctomycetia bacterium]|nr:hypothetical protein [Planctomycetia bacterium]MCC7315022.1 hypothetical protein [Planctomycetota bacterium]